MRVALMGLLVLVAALAGCGMTGAGGEQALLNQLQGLGGVICTAYDFNHDGHATIDELRQVFGTLISDQDLQDALTFYGCQ